MALNKKSALRDAKTWLKENPSESPSIAARIFDVVPSSLYSSIARDSPT
jgi:hypothetical protein